MCDKLIGAGLWYCVFLGALANTQATIYFWKELGTGLHRTRRDNNKHYFTLLYLLVAATDVTITSTAFPVALSYVRDRTACLFNYHLFCTLWGFIWEIIPYLSVYLIMVMAVSRASTLTRPLKVLNTKAMLSASCLYLLVCCTSKIVPQLLMYDITTSYAYGTFHFNKDSLYCFLYPAGRYWVFSSIQSSIQLGLPAPVILASCGVCLIVLHTLSRRCKKLSYKRGAARRKPTTTILILSLVYMACNVPVLLNYVLYSFTWVAGRAYSSVYYSTFLYWYSWNLSYVVSVCVNSTINPVVLIVRMTAFRQWVRNKFKSLTIALGDVFGECICCLSLMDDASNSTTSNNSRKQNL